MRLLDWLARNLGYHTSADMAVCVRAAEEAATKMATELSPVAGDAGRHNRVPEGIPAGYLRYFVSYNFSAGNGCGGFGCIEIGRAQTIRNQEDIVGILDLIADTLKGRGYANPGVVILNWQPFELPRKDDGGREVVDNDMPSTVVLRLVA